MPDDPIRRVLRTQRLTLRPIATADVEFVFGHFSNPDVHRYLVDSPPVTSLTQARSIVEFYTDDDTDTAARWVITRTPDGEPIGTCGFHLWSKSHRRAEVGYDLAPSSWGHGLMTEALVALLGHGFDEMDLHRIAAAIHPDNVASLLLAERLGFVHEGIARDLFLQGSAYHDHWVLSLLAGELHRPERPAPAPG